LLDIGCGSGVLAIAAAKLGWEGVIAVDHDRESVTATADNAAANGVHLDVRRLDLRRDELPRAATIVANLLAPLLLELAHRLPAAPRELIAGGLLAGQEEDVAAALRDSHGLHEKERRTEGEWVALLLTRN
jgi:ribosomal protein L11 methyltransferase